MARQRILIIEDDPQMREMVCEMLEGLGVALSQAGNGAEGMALFHRLSPALVITDIIMPEKEGLSVVREIKTANPDTPVLVITGGDKTFPGELLGQVAEITGSDGVLLKPFTQQELRHAVLSLLPLEN